MATTKSKTKSKKSAAKSKPAAKKAATAKSVSTRAAGNDQDLLTKLVAVWLALIFVFLLLVIFKLY